MTAATHRPAVGELEYRVYNAPVHVEFFTFAARFLLGGHNWRAEIGLCADGHVITFRYGQLTLCEVLSATRSELPDGRLVRHRKLRGNRTERYDEAPRLVYQCCQQVERLDPEVYHRLHEELVLDSSRLRIACRFSDGNRLSPPPLSLMRVEEQPGNLLIHAFHTFPNDLSVVKTQSLFEVSDAPAK